MTDLCSRGMTSLCSRGMTGLISVFVYEVIHDVVLLEENNLVPALDDLGGAEFDRPEPDLRKIEHILRLPGVTAETVQDLVPDRFQFEFRFHIQKTFVKRGPFISAFDVG